MRTSNKELNLDATCDLLRSRSSAQSAETLLLKPAAAAKLLSISERTLWSLTNRGEIPCVRIGRSVRYDRRDLADWINSKKGGQS